MKKLLAVLAVAALAVGLSGCEAIQDSVLQEQIDTLQTQIDELDSTDSYTKEELDEIFDFAEQDWTVQDFVNYIDDLEDLVEAQEPNQIERWIDAMFREMLQDGDMVFVELGDNIIYQVESYGYSPTYILEILEPTTIQFNVSVDNDLEFCYYPETMFGEGYECTDLAPDSLFNDGDYVFTVDVRAGFFEFDFESWDDTNDSILNITVSEVTKND